MRGRGRVEGLVPVFDDRRWDCAYAWTTAETILQEFVPHGDRHSEWHELVTVRALGVPSGAALADYVESGRSAIEARVVVDGEFDWRILLRRDDDMIYSWTIEHDVAAVDQLELVRVVRGATAMHSLHYAIRAPLAEAAAARAQWLPRLESTALDRRPPPARTSSPVPAKARVALDTLMATPDLDPQTSPACISTARRALSLMERPADPMLWAILNFLLGNHLAGGIGDFENAIVAYRQALEVYTLEAVPDLWARAMKRLGEAFSARADGDPAANAAHAAAAFRQALRVFARGTEAWAQTTLALADVERPLKTKEGLYAQVVRSFVEDPGLAGDLDNAAELVIRASTGIQNVDRIRGGEVIVAPGFGERKTRGGVAYLRPLITSGELTLKNKFRDPAALAVQYEREPGHMTLEGVLNRVLSPHFDVIAIGGRPEGYGPSRILMTPDLDWKGVFNIVFDLSILVLIVPHKSDGVRWEAEQLVARRALGKTLFVMPPTSRRFDADAMWKKGRKLLANYRLRLPRYDPAGMFVHLDPDGAVAESWPFEVVWSNTLVERIEHLLPKPAGGR